MLAGCSSTQTEEVKEEPAATVQVEESEVEKEAEEETVVGEAVEVEVTEVVDKPEEDIHEGVD